MPMMFSKKDYDFDLSELPYKVGALTQYLSMQGGVFSWEWDFSEAGIFAPMQIRNGLTAVSVSLIGTFDIELYDEDGAAADIDDDFPCRRLIANSLRNRFRALTGVREITIFEMKIKSVDCESIFKISSEIIIMDSNQQSITGVCLGAFLSETPDFLNCLVALTPGQTRYVSFRE